MAANLIAHAGSMRLCITLVISLVVVSVLGAVLPQSLTTPGADDIYRSYGLFWYRLITRLSLDDVFHSTWFLALVAVFAVNLTACSIGRLRRSIPGVIRRPSYFALSTLDKDTERVDLVVSVKEGLRIVERVLRLHGLRRIDQVAENQIVARRWRWSRLAPDAVHLGVMIILFGALLGFYQQEGTFGVNEWEKGIVMPACANTNQESEDCLPLPYNVRIEDFGVETFDDGGAA